jgi:DNA-binding CsgD family transcriptional regulator
LKTGLIPVAGAFEGTASGNVTTDILGIWPAAFDALALPVYVVQSDGRLVFANSAAQVCLTHGRWFQSHGGRVRPSSEHDADPPLGSALERLRQGGGSNVLLTHQRSGRQAVATVAPIALTDKGLARTGDEGTERLGLLWLTTSNPDVTAPIRVMAELFKLTRAEQQLLTVLAAGVGLREVASRLELSIHTVRNQLKSVLSKTGRHSQAQLLAMVARMACLGLSESEKQFL